jgi:serine protease Do
MEGKLSLRMVGIVAGAAAVFAFLFGLIISTGIPAFVNKTEASPSPGISTPIPLVNEAGESPFVAVAEQVSPAVVNISAEHKVSAETPDMQWGFGGPFDDLFRDFFKNFPRNEGRSQTLGSGFIISDDGYIITNFHVIKDASNIIVKLVDKREFKGDEVKVIGSDARTDLALLKISTKDKLHALLLGDSDKIKVGDWVIAFGNPFNLEGTVTVGVISAKGRSNITLPEGPDFQSFLQTDAAINPGNSGGPLVDIHGEVVGINSAITSPSGGNVGIGFAIPINLAKTVIDELRDKGKVTRGYIGIYLQDITDDIKEGMGLSSLSGVLVSEVMENTPASRAGLKNGDVILEIDGKKVEDVQSFRITIASLPVGKTVSLKVFRDGKEKNVQVTVGEMPAEQNASVEEEKESGLGLTVVNVNDPRADQFQLDVTIGVIVITVQPGSAAEKAGIAAGDVIMGIGKSAIKSVVDYKKAVAGLAKGKPVIFQLQRNQRKVYVALTP